MIDRRLYVSFLFLTFCAACNPDLDYSVRPNEPNGGSLEEKTFESVIQREDSYIAKSVSVASYSGSFKVITNNELVSTVMDKVIENANKRVSDGSYDLAYAIPPQFLNEHPSAGQMNRSYSDIDKFDDTPSVIIRQAKVKEFDDSEITLESIRENKNQDDFFDYAVNTNSADSDIMADFFGTSEIMD